MGRLLTTRQAKLPATAAVALGRRALDVPLGGDAELTVTEITTSATVLGAFQRPHGIPVGPPWLRRVSGGPYTSVGPGTLHVLLRLANPAALVPCDPRRLLNRYVRPLLRALTKSGALAHYFGREWISVSHRPVGQVGFAHDSRTGRCLFEAFVAVDYPFAPAGRGSFLGKLPGTLESVLGRAFDPGVVAKRIVEAYASQADFSREAESPREADATPDAWDDPPWAATAEAAIGLVAAGADAGGTLRLGGDLLASRDVLDRVASAVAALPADASLESIGAIVDRELASPAVALEGVRDLAQLRDVLARGR